jgi:tetratricopeptide (TPR) repeat protein
MGNHSGKKKQAAEKIGAKERVSKSSPGPDATGLTAQPTGNAAYVVAVLVAVLTFLVYLETLSNNFLHWDTSLYVTENPNIRSFNLAFLRWAFLDFYASNWHPLTWISHALDYALWGLDPLGHHLTNNILHAANTFLVVVLTAKLFVTDRARTQKTTDSFLGDRRSLIAGVVTGLLFGLHPIHVSSVAWVAERKDVLCAFFFLLSILMYMEYARHQNAEETGNGRTVRKNFFINKHYLSALGFFALALLSKPMAVSLPLVLLILDWHPFERIGSLRSLKRVVAEKLPFITLSLISSILTVLAQKSGGAVVHFKVLPLSTRLAVAVKSLIGYLQKMIIPLHLSPYYAYPNNASFLSFEYLLPLLLVIGITLLSLFFASRHKLWLSVWSYYVITLLPVLGIIQVGGQAMADRYTYLPAIGPFLLVGILAARVSANTDSIKKQRFKLFGLLVAVFLLFSSLTYITLRQIGIWNNDFTLWDHVIRNQRRKVPFVYYHRGLASMKMGRVDMAMQDFNKAIALDPSDYYAYVNRGMLYSRMDLLDMALEDFDKAIALNPRSYEAYTNKGMVYGRAGLFEEAIDQFDDAIELRPDSAIAYGNRGLAYFLLEQYSNALEDLNEAIQLDENYAEAYGTRGNLYLKTGNRELAVSDFQKACDLGDEKGCDVLKRYGG